MKEIKTYRYAWNITDNIGHVQLKLEDGKWTKWKKHDNAMEFQIIITTLREEAPVFLKVDKYGKYYLQTTDEPVGESEF